MFVKKKATFWESLKHCKSLGGSLAAPETEEDMLAIKDEIGVYLKKSVIKIASQLCKIQSYNKNQHPQGIIFVFRCEL